MSFRFYQARVGDLLYTKNTEEDKPDGYWWLLIRLETRKNRSGEDIFCWFGIDLESNQETAIFYDWDIYSVQLDMDLYRDGVKVEQEL